MLPTSILTSACVVSLSCTLCSLFSIVVAALWWVAFFIVFVTDPSCLWKTNNLPLLVSILTIAVASIFSNLVRAQTDNASALSYETRGTCELNYQRLRYQKDHRTMPNSIVAAQVCAATEDS
jgi:hypothetical protein